MGQNMQQKLEQSPFRANAAGGRVWFESGLELGDTLSMPWYRVAAAIMAQLKSRQMPCAPLVSCLSGSASSLG